MAAALIDPQPDGTETEHKGTQGVQAALEPFAAAQKGQRLQAEGRKRRVAAAEADSNKNAPIGTDKQPAAGSCEGKEQADDKRSGDVYEKRAPRERFAQQPGQKKRAAVTGHPAEGAAEAD